jgi:hypothetical protein
MSSCYAGSPVEIRDLTATLTATPRQNGVHQRAFTDIEQI